MLRQRIVVSGGVSVFTPLLSACANSAIHSPFCLVPNCEAMFGTVLPDVHLCTGFISVFECVPGLHADHKPFSDLVASVDNRLMAEHPLLSCKRAANGSGDDGVSIRYFVMRTAEYYHPVTKERVTFSESPVTYGSPRFLGEPNSGYVSWFITAHPHIFKFFLVLCSVTLGSLSFTVSPKVRHWGALIRIMSAFHALWNWGTSTSSRRVVPLFLLLCLPHCFSYSPFRIDQLLFWARLELAQYFLLQMLRL